MYKIRLSKSSHHLNQLQQEGKLHWSIQTLHSPLAEHVAVMQRPQMLLIHAAGLWRHSDRNNEIFIKFNICIVSFLIFLHKSLCISFFIVNSCEVDEVYDN